MEKYIQDRQNSIINNITKSFDNREEIIKGLDGEIIVYDEIYTPESINQFQKDLNKAFSNGKLTQEEFEKGKKDLSRLAMRQVFDKNGHKRIVYVKIHEDEHGKTHETDFDKDDDVKFTKDGKEFSGKIKSLKFHDKTDKVGTAMVVVDGKTYSVSLSKLEHHDEDETKSKNIKPKDGSLVIGTTKSGKKIYQDGREHEDDSDWTSEDHKQAAEAIQHHTLDRTEYIGQKVSNADLSKNYTKHVQKSKNKQPKYDIHDDAKKIAKFHGLSDKEYSVLHPDSKSELKNSYESYKEESNKQNKEILRRHEEVKKLKEEKTIMQEVGGEDNWSNKTKALHLAKYIGKDEDFIKNLSNSGTSSNEIGTKLKGLEKEYLDWEKTKMEDATITYRNKFNEVVTTETKGMTPKEIKNHIGGDIISIKSSKKEKKEDTKDEINQILDKLDDYMNEDMSSVESKNHPAWIPDEFANKFLPNDAEYYSGKKWVDRMSQDFNFLDKKTQEKAKNWLKRKIDSYEERQSKKLAARYLSKPPKNEEEILQALNTRRIPSPRAIEWLSKYDEKTKKSILDKYRKSGGYEDWIVGIERQVLKKTLNPKEEDKKESKDDKKRENKVNKSIDKNDIEKAFNTLGTF